MNTEFEAKFLDITKSGIRAKLKQLGAELVQPERLMRRTMFGKEDNAEMAVDYIRVRDESNIVRLSAKVHALSTGSLSDQKETDILVSNYDDTVSIMNLAGLVQSGYQENKRESWELDGVQIEIDTWPGLETYIEIEADSELAVKQMANRLGVSWNDKIITSVMDLYMAAYDLSQEMVVEKMRTITFENHSFGQ